VFLLSLGHSTLCIYTHYCIYSQTQPKTC